MQESLEHLILNWPGLNSLYQKRAARLKRRVCLFLDRFGLLKPYSFVQWLVTNRCNAVCPFCESSSGKARPEELTYEEALKLIRDLGGMKVRRLLLSGGEPLIRWEIPRLCRGGSKSLTNTGVHRGNSIT